MKSVATPTLDDVRAFAANPWTANCHFMLRLLRRLDGHADTRQIDVATYLGVPRKTYASWENGQNNFDVSPMRGPVFLALVLRHALCRRDTFVLGDSFSPYECTLAERWSQAVSRIPVARVKPKGFESISATNPFAAFHLDDVYELVNAVYTKP